LDFKYDVAGRRSEKKVNGHGTRYLYDGPHVIAEYDGNNNLLRKYIYGPSIDQPVSMIEVADGNAAYYYHYDALGSVIALSDSSGDTVQTYEYSVFGEPAVEDANHTNPYMFAGRRYDIEIGLYYNRARYYNPYTGRFLQTDPIGYGDGINWYAYCGNNPLNYSDPGGLYSLPLIPKECLLPLGDTIDQYDLTTLVTGWLIHADFWAGGKYSLWNVGEVAAEGDNIRIELDWTGDEGDEYVEPNFDVTWVKLEHEEGHPKEGEYYGKVPIVFFDGIGLLTDRALNRIIYSAIQEINGWSGGGLFGAGVLPARDIFAINNLLNNWDCEYFKNGPRFRYDDQVFSGADINYIVGGHAFRHYRWSETEALGAVAAWKSLYGHSADSPEMASVYWWFLKGYDEYSSRSGW
jgi:RHS repeat-associated protein